MMLLMDKLQPLSGYMGVNLSRRKITVSLQQLHHAQIRPVVQQMGRKGVPQNMGGRAARCQCPPGWHNV